MKKRTIYYETLRGGLLPVAIVSVNYEDKNVTVKAKRTKYGYKTGDVFKTVGHHLVNKARVINGAQYVETAFLFDEGCAT